MDNSKSQFFDYSFFQSLYEEGFSGWKGFYFREAQKRFETEFTKIGRWGWSKKERKFGILTESGEWDDLNRFNTHPNLYKFVYEECIKSNPNCFIDFGNPIHHEHNVMVMWDFLTENFDLYFTKKITEEKYNKIYKLLNNSWQRGNISVIIAVEHLKKAFPDLTNIEYGFKSGESKDMMGIDVEITLSNGDTKTFQIKGGRYVDKNYGGFYYVNGSANDLDYGLCDYYVYSQTKWKDTLSQIIIFKNTKNLKKKDKNTLLVPVNDVVYKTQQFMSMPENLSKLMEICSKNDIEFRIQREEEEPSITYNEEEKRVTVNFNVIENNNSLLLGIKKMIGDLEQRFK